jgi:hypothetical protein
VVSSGLSAGFPHPISSRVMQQLVTARMAHSLVEVYDQAVSR